MSVRSSLRLALLLLVTALTACALPRHAAAQPGRGTAAVRYHLELPAPHRQYLYVTMEVDAPRGRTSRVAMPAWTPGSYLVRDYGRHVYDLSAEDRRGRPLPVRALDKQTWRVEHGGRPFTVRYRVFAAEPSVRTSHVDDRHASIVGTSAFLYVVDELGRPVHLEVRLPEGWSAHTALAEAEAEAPPGLARFTAPDYDALVDAPLELGTPRVATFDEGGARFEYVLSGAEDTTLDLDRLAGDAQRVVRAQGELMGGFPFARYVFLMRVSEHGGGGLEHAHSTSMMMRRRDFDEERGYERAAALAAHEFFHLWNVKRIHDRVLGPFDYAKENHTRLLWLHEGFTETMEGLSLRRAELLEPDDWVKQLGHRFTQYLRKPGRNHEPIAQVSFDAWTRAYQPAPNHPNVAISYYEKGDFIGIALDLELRLRSGGRGSLPGLFRRLMASHGAKGIGITMADVITAASAEAGQDMGEFFARYVEGTEEVPLLALLPRVGVKVVASAPWLDDDGRPVASPTPAQRRQRQWTGLQLSPDATIRNVLPDSPADRAGLMRDDELLAVGELRVHDRSDALARLADHALGETVELTLFRGARLVQLELTPVENPTREHQLSLVPDAELSPDVLALRTAWLRGASP